MIKLKLKEEWTDYLLRLPESGMGYQRVDVRFNDGSVQNGCTVFNADTIELPDTCKGKTITDIQLHIEK